MNQVGTLACEKHEWPLILKRVSEYFKGISQ